MCIRDRISVSVRRVSFEKDKIIENTHLSDEDILIKSITTKGDQVQDTRLSEVGGKGLFSKNIEKELMAV